MSIKPKKSTNIVGPIKLPVLLNNRRMAEFLLYYFSLYQGGYYALVKGEINGSEYPLVRIHSACNIAHIFSSQRCDCKPQLDLAIRKIHEEGKGVLIYVLPHEGRGVGSLDHMRVYQKQDEGLDTVDSYLALGLPVDRRNYEEIKIILDFFDLKNIRLLTNNPKKVEAMTVLGYDIKRVPLIAKLTSYNQSQIRVKIEKLGHIIPIFGDSDE
ncbi:MAG: GTP cyclohydrolase II [Candidatus Micrarchaeota archaeon]